MDIVEGQLRGILSRKNEGERKKKNEEKIWRKKDWRKGDKITVEKEIKERQEESKGVCFTNSFCIFTGVYNIMRYNNIMFLA